MASKLLTVTFSEPRSTRPTYDLSIPASKASRSYAGPARRETCANSSR